MYQIFRDGQLLYQSGAEKEAHIALNVKLSLDIESAGSLSFVLPPGNAQYDRIVKMKSIITMVQDGVQIFRGRVLDDERDAFNQKSIYCEGDQSFLLDSLWEEQVFQGKAQEFFWHLISNHNNQVEQKKRFRVGEITAVSAEEPYNGEIRVETRRFWDTSTVLDDRLLSVYGGYLRTRTAEDGGNYIDWLKDFDEIAQQPIRFGVNMLDLTDKLDASDVFTCLIPLGHSAVKDDGTYEDPVNITSVNGGVEYLQDDEAVEKYGRIWRHKTWENEKDPAKLKKKALDFLKTGAEFRTLTLTALDMHFTDDSIDMIRIGTRVRISSNPHGIALRMVCAKIDLDPDNPENTRYTFGVKPRTLSEAVIRNQEDMDKVTGTSRRGGGGGGRSAQQELEEVLRWARITVNQANANINLNAGSIDRLTGRVTSAEIDIDGLNGEITLKANKVYVDAEITKVRTLVADEIDALYADINYAIANSISTKALTVDGNGWVNGTLTAGTLSTGGLKLGGASVSKTTLPVVTSFTQALGQSSPTTDYTILTTSVGKETTLFD